MFNRVAYGHNWRPYNYSEFVCDSDADVASLPTTANKECAVGSMAFVPSTGNTYVLNGSGEWIQSQYSGGGGGGGKYVPDEDVATDEDIDEMIDDVFGDGGESGEETPPSPSDEVDDGTVTSDEEFNEMINDIFGDDASNNGG